MDMKKLLESNLQQEQQRRLILAESYKEYIDAASAVVEKMDGRTLTDMDKANIARCLENAVDYVRQLQSTSQWGMLNEATQANYINFLGIKTLCAA